MTSMVLSQQCSPLLAVSISGNKSCPESKWCSYAPSWNSPYLLLRWEFSITPSPRCYIFSIWMTWLRSLYTPMYFLNNARAWKCISPLGFRGIIIPAHLPDCVASYKDVKWEKVTVADGMIPRFVNMNEKRIQWSLKRSNDFLPLPAVASPCLFDYIQNINSEQLR